MEFDLTSTVGRTSSCFLLLSQVDRNFHFACPATKKYTPKCPARRLFRIRSNGKDPAVRSGPLPRPKSHDLPDFESISRTPPPANSPPLSRLVSPCRRAHPAGNGNGNVGNKSSRALQPLVMSLEQVAYLVTKYLCHWIGCRCTFAWSRFSRLKDENTREAGLGLYQE